MALCFSNRQTLQRLISLGAYSRALWVGIRYDFNVFLDYATWTLYYDNTVISSRIVARCRQCSIFPLSVYKCKLLKRSTRGVPLFPQALHRVPRA